MRWPVGQHSKSYQWEVESDNQHVSQSETQKHETSLWNKKYPPLISFHISFLLARSAYDLKTYFDSYSKAPKSVTTFN